MFESERHKNCLKRQYPWYRKGISEQDLIPETHTPYDMPLRVRRARFRSMKENNSLDIDTKRAALKAAPSVVALLSYTGEEKLIQCCGVIIEKDGTNGYIVLTSAKLVRRPSDESVMENKLADNLKITICLDDGASHEGQVCAYDFHYNIAWIRFQSDSSIAIASLGQVDDYMNVNPAEEKSFHLRPHSSHFSIVPSHAIVAMGRYFVEPFHLMAAPGEINLARCDDFDCQELISGTCYITKCGEGGPLINLAGKVIGITFFEFCETPFLPINIAQKCWEHYKRYGVIW